MGLREGGAGTFVQTVADVTVDIASVVTQTAVDTAVLVPTSIAGDGVNVMPLGVWPAGVTQPQGRCLVDGTVQTRVANVTVGAVDPASQTFRYFLMHDRP